MAIGKSIRAKFGISLVMLALAVSIALSGAPANASPVMVGYFPAFKGLDGSLETTPIDHYTHLNIAFANPDATGALSKNGVMACMPDGAGNHVSVATLRDTAAKLRAKGAKVLLSVAGGVIPSCSGDWSALLKKSNRDAIKTGLLAILDEAHLDGIDIDIEGALLTKIDRDGNYTPFIAALSKELKAKGKLLTAATASYEGGMIPVSSIPYFDLIMPMSYDVIGPSWGQAGSEHSSYEQAEREIDLWLKRGVKREHLVLGVPFYGYGFGSYQSGYSFSDILTTYGNAATAGDVIGEACAGCDYITFNSPATLTRKAELAKTRASGIMVWEITQDTADQLLGKTISETLNPSN